jgi:hypothetical protein
MSELECGQIVDTITPNATTVREKLAALEAEMKKYPSVEIKTTHHFAKGVYAREIFIPKGTLLTGKIHKTEHLNIVSQGDISVLTENGPKRVKAPFAMVSQAGIKRAGYAHEDTVWTTIHANVLEEVLIAADYDALPILEAEAVEVQPCLG